MAQMPKTGSNMLPEDVAVDEEDSEAASAVDTGDSVVVNVVDSVVASAVVVVDGEAVNVAVNVVDGVDVDEERVIGVAAMASTAVEDVDADEVCELL